MCGCCADVPVVCTLTHDDMSERIREFQTLFAEALADLEREPLRLRLRFDVDVPGEAPVRDLMAREKQCCAFLGFGFTRSAAGLVVDITAPEGAEAALDPIHALAQQEIASRVVAESPGR